MTVASSPKSLVLATGKDLPVSVHLSSEHGFDPTGLTVTAFLALTKGGAAITSPDTRVTLTEITTTSSTRRQYRGTIDDAVVDLLLASSTDTYWLNVAESTGGLDDWYPVPVVRDGYAELA